MSEWHSIPEDTLPGQFRVRDFVELEDGSLMRILACSTIMIELRPIYWWERLWYFGKRGGER